ncbi:acetamidase/formamidase family protein [Microbispora sp. NEAU-D428]|uniref:acetamidase/formamidase family protein n=1 Tax=Microbispora sitophila TaxID=2771537 RepID=UPI00186774E5|nr:acetamidase/formamidase family protein [Microbispora sitophila]MBE3009623.1 acetamidase/formamidase family protein [Microbispora sitophila]
MTVSYDLDPEADPAGLTYTFGGAAPVLSIKPGTALSTWTRDCFAGRVRSASDRVSEVCDPRFINPQTGPFYIEGAEPGDTLAVHFVSIEPREARGVSTTVPFFGALTGTGTTALLHEALPERTWIYEIDRQARLVRYSALESPYEVDLPLDPMHGTVGVAPALGEVRSSLAPGDWGGNMDTPEMRAGTTCYLGVNVEGALFSFGDGHARQGEGETCGVAVETAMDTVVIVDLIKGAPCPWPRLENDDFIITTGSAKPLEDAFRIAHAELTKWLAAETGLSTLDAYQLVSQAALTPVANVVDTVYTMTAKLPKAVLKGAAPMGGAHARLRAMAAAL